MSYNIYITSRLKYRHKEMNIIPLPAYRLADLEILLTLDCSAFRRVVTETVMMRCLSQGSAGGTLYRHMGINTYFEKYSLKIFHRYIHET